MRFKGFKIGKIGKSKEKPEEDTVEAGDTTAAQMTKAEDLKETAQQAEGISDASNKSEEAGEATPQPHGPLGELTVEPEDELLDLDAKADTISSSEEADEEVKVVEVGTEAAATAEEVKVVEAGTEAAATAKAGTEPKQEGEGDALTNLFSDDDEEVNPLANLINTLPEVTLQELLDDLQEINEIIREGQHQ